MMMILASEDTVRIFAHIHVVMALEPEEGDFCFSREELLHQETFKYEYFCASRLLSVLVPENGYFCPKRQGLFTIR
jgi:hypothetical protein